MKHLAPIVILAAGAGLLLLGWSLGRTPAAAPPPNVVFLLLDTVRADRLDGERGGTPIMPGLRSLAEEGAWFTRAISNCSWTKPAMASMFTAQHVYTHQVWFGARGDGAEAVSDVLPDALQTLAEYLVERGYATCAMQTNAMVTAETGFAQGFPLHCYTFINGLPGGLVTDRALEKAAGMEPPFFLYAHYMDAHAPYMPPEPYRSRFGPLPELPANEQAMLEDPSGFMDYLMDTALHYTGARPERRFPPLSEAAREAVRILYDGECASLDAEAARLIHGIRAAHPNTIFVLVSDHGEEFWERGGMGHGTTLHAEQLDVPFAILGPGIPARRIETPVETLDILPTLASLLGFPPRPQWQGRNLLAPEGPAPRPLFAATRASWEDMNVNQGAVIDGGHKLILDHVRGERLLFDLEADPGEQRNLAADLPERAAALEALFEAHVREAQRARSPRIAPVTHPLDPESLEQLRALGYMQ